ncbi:MAG TPA: RNA 3'-terminal phosphate cyclase [Thermodesulfobacteriota bacterium]|nr:RNA 3'-terminal phosphate cyclase [Thermodesulfobacteriota bacterium]
MRSAQEGLIEIDGSYGEGGGQVLRTALALSAILKRPFTISGIRSKRKNPGLQAQHLEAVKALTRITGAQTEGAAFGSQSITFIPRGLLPGSYEFEVSTAGSVTLLLQAILLPLCFAKGISNVTLTGGTHVEWSPSFHYLAEVLLPTLEKTGVSANATIESWGFYPKGAGMIRLKICPVEELKSISLVDRGDLKKIRGVSAISNLPGHVADRQREQALKRIREELGMHAEIAVLGHVPSKGSGSFLFLLAEYERVVTGFSSLGAKGKPAEKVADEAVDLLEEYVSSEGCVDLHLADQLIPFMALAKGNSSFTTTRVTEHLLTNIWVVERFWEAKVRQWGSVGKPGRVEFLNE